MNRCLLLFTIALSTTRLSALDIDCEPGLLSSKIEHPQSVSSLILTGVADASDFYFLSRECTVLRSLDMSALTIAAYIGDAPGMASNYQASAIPASVFAGSELSSVFLPVGCTVGDFAFAGSPLTTVVIPDGTTLGDGVFAHCTDLVKVKLGKNVKTAHSSFRNCTALSEIEGSGNLTDISDYAFEGCTALKSFDFGEKLLTVGAGAFENSGLESADLSGCRNLTSVGRRAFAGMSALTSAAMPEHLASLGEGVFFGDRALAAVTLPADLEFIPSYAFKDVSELDEMQLPENLVSIQPYAMMGVSKVTSLALPASLEYIGEGAMEDMTGLANIDAVNLGAVPETGADVWSGVEQDKVDVRVSPALENSFRSALQWQNFNIVGESMTIVETIVADSVYGAFHGELLVLESTELDFENIMLSDVSGRILVDLQKVAAAAVTIDISRFDTPVYIVSCTLADGTRVALKLAR